MSELTSLLLHKKTRDHAARLQQNQPHGILITGPAGSGKRTLAAHMAADLLQVHPDRLNKLAYFHAIDPKENSISIDDIRALQQFLKLKVPATKPGIQRVVTIIDADRMRTEAQNALLKTLEEPPADTCIILTAPSTDALLPTIVSRTTELQALPAAKSDAAAYFAGKGVGDIERAYSLSQGQAGLLNALMTTKEHELIGSVELAKQIISEPVGKRLLRTESVAKDRDAAAMLLSAMQRIAHAALIVASKQGKTTGVRQWHEKQAAITEAEKKLRYNVNLKLLLDDLFMSI